MVQPCFKEAELEIPGEVCRGTQAGVLREGADFLSGAESVGLREESDRLRVCS
ncbi:MAG: hypothetical protein QF752_07220 [Planctomycetota bacterium]|nr:hypothetical protein [Planctomycetota bacterium]